MSGLRRSWQRRRYRRRAATEIDVAAFAEFGAGSFIHPPAIVLGHERIRIGDDVVVHPGAFLSVIRSDEHRSFDPWLVIGDRVRLGFDVVVACNGLVEIGADVLTADRVFIGDTFHEYRDITRPIADQGLAEPRPVRIGDGAFLGVNSVVLPGVTVGAGGYVGAGAVITSDVPAHSVAVGNPARIIRRHDGERWVDVDER